MNKYLLNHLKKYPKMQVQDKIKLLMQAHLGCGHLVNDYEKVLKRTTDELNEINNSNDDLIEEISDKYVRVYLKPYFDKYHSFENLIKAFIVSSKEEGNIDAFLKDLESLRYTLDYEDEAFLDEYLEKKEYLISHSKVYKDEYNPHYLVICKKYLQTMFKY